MVHSRLGSGLRKVERAGLPEPSLKKYWLKTSYIINFG
jgi:hypothetical protein